MVYRRFCVRREQLEPIELSNKAEVMSAVENTGKEKCVFEFYTVSADHIIFSRSALDVAVANAVSEFTVLRQLSTQNCRRNFFEELAMSFT